MYGNLREDEAGGQERRLMQPRCGAQSDRLEGEVRALREDALAWPKITMCGQSREEMRADGRNAPEHGPPLPSGYSDRAGPAEAR